MCSSDLNFGRDLLRRLRRAPRMALRGFRSSGRFIKSFVTGANIINESQRRHGRLAVPLACPAALRQHYRRALACRCEQRLALPPPTDIIGRSRMRKVTRGLNFDIVPVCEIRVKAWKIRVKFGNPSQGLENPSQVWKSESRLGKSESRMGKSELSLRNPTY